MKNRLSRVASSGGQQLPLNNTFVEVELEWSRRCFSLSREWLDYCSLKDEVIIPTVAPRVEEAHERASLGIERTDIATLPRIASKAGIG